MNNSTDKSKIARVIADMLGIPNANKMTPEQVVLAGSKIMKSKQVNPDLEWVVKKMLNLAKDAGMKITEETGSVLDGGVDVMQPITSSGLGITKRQRFKEFVSKKTAPHMDNHDEDPHTEVGQSLENPTPEKDDDQLRRRKVDYKMSESTEVDMDDVLDDLEDEDESDLDELAKEIDDEEDILDAYDDDEISIVDSETGEEEKDESIDESVLMEVLSKAERIRAKMRFMKTKAKRERKLQIALHKRSDNKTLAKRARILAIKLIKKKIMKKALNSLSVTEKERLEKIIAKRKKVIDRLAMRLLPRIKKIENERLSHEKVTQ